MYAFGPHMVAYIVCGLGSMFFLFGAYAVCIYATNQALEVIKCEHHISEATYRLHRALIRSLVVQMLVPFSCMTVALSAILCSIALDLSCTKRKSSFLN